MATIDYKQKIKDYMNSSEVDTLYKSMLNNLFPELKESEDERIRKAIIVYLRSILSNKKYGDKSIEYWIAWLEKKGKTFTKKDIDDAYLKGVCDAKQELEKQGEQNLIMAKSPQLGEQKSADKVEPKFKVGDWILIDNPCQIEGIDSNGNYIVRYCNAEETHLLSSKFCDSHFHLWSIRDAKDGDVLVHNAVTFIFMGIENGIVKGICTELSDTILNFGEPEYDNDYCPATKEQRDQLEKAMSDAGYTFDFEKKELRKIKQNNAWSEEDEIAFGDALWCCKQAASIAKDENEMGNAWYAERWLKSLKPQNKWKPSDKHIEVLWKYAKQSNYDGMLLTSLYNDLKKLI